MAYGLGILFFAAGFFVSLVGLAWSLTAGGFLDWISPRPTRRGATVILGTVSLGITFFLAAALKWETWDNAPWLVRWLSAHYGFAWIPWLLFVPCGLLLVRRQLASIGYLTIRLPLAAMLGICAAFVLGSLMGWSWTRAKPSRLDWRNCGDRTSNNWAALELAAWQPEQGLGPLLPLTNRFQDQLVREAAWPSSTAARLGGPVAGYLRRTTHLPRPMTSGWQSYLRHGEIRGRLGEQHPLDGRLDSDRGCANQQLARLVVRMVSGRQRVESHRFPVQHLRSRF